MLPLGMYSETYFFWVIWSCTSNCSLTKEPSMFSAVAVATIYSCTSSLIIKIALLCCFGFFKINLVSDTTLICASVSNLKVLSVPFAFKLAVHSSAAVLPIDFPWAAHGDSAFLLSVLHTPCWCLHVLIILLVYYIPPHVPCIFSVRSILQHYVWLHALFLMDSHTADFSPFTLQV